MSRSPITTHVLDVALGCPAKGVAVTLEIQDGAAWITLSSKETDSDGRVEDLLPASGSLKAGVYRLTFAVSGYQVEQRAGAFFPIVPVVFAVHDPERHYHVPLLLSPFGYSIYRGS